VKITALTGPLKIGHAIVIVTVKANMKITALTGPLKMQAIMKGMSYMHKFLRRNRFAALCKIV